MKNSNYDIAYLRKYLRGELNAKEMHAVERSAQDDPMLMDILLGMEFENEFTQDIPLRHIQQRIQERTAQVPNKTRPINWRYMSIAATFLFLSGVALFYFQQNQKIENQTASVDKVAPQIKGESKYDSSEQHNESSANVAAPSASETLPNTKRTEVKIAQAQPKAESIRRDQIETEELSNTYPSINKEITLDSFQVLANTELAGKVSGLYISPNRFEKNENKKGKSILGAVNTVTDDALHPSTISQGTIIDSRSGSPIEGASIQLKKSKYTTVSDLQGKFTIPIIPKDSIIDVFAIGYNAAHLNYISMHNNMIQLAPDNATLNEIVVSGYRKKIELKKSAPIGGRQSFDEYIKREIQQLQLKGKVKLIFALDIDGSPSRIQIMESTNTVLDQNLIRILRNGPKWERGKDANQIQITFKF
ncbi:carboxypeptidase-like regulatory domain-containing protein [Sphingobacterium sp. SRCM116780]|uniref:energy transducer TonB family protein n=1 Tax=Sphingobacterium sp. SRCM116780 TaxID=2907623 RepID=UPI001F387436|nr:energy transducer TonB [Sphingobacterium sp. SRCM116780]UIR54989.1 carboxypeptidase-like regulatory domain-containing protein [Sphingobacterium sp. SRCM116780]